MSYGAGNPLAPRRHFVLVFRTKWNTCAALDHIICAFVIHRRTAKIVVARGSMVCVRVGKYRCTRNHHILERMTAGWGRLSWPGNRAGVGLGRGHGWSRRALLALGHVASWKGRYAGWNLWGTVVVQPFWDPRGVGEGRFIGHRSRRCGNMITSIVLRPSVVHVGCRGGIFQHQVRAWKSNVVGLSPPGVSENWACWSVCASQPDAEEKICHWRVAYVRNTCMVGPRDTAAVFAVFHGCSKVLGL